MGVAWGCGCVMGLWVCHDKEADGLLQEWGGRLGGGVGMGMGGE